MMTKVTNRSLCLLIVFASLSVLSVICQENKYDYGIMFDAGSSSTKVNIYVWDRKNVDTLYDDPNFRTAPIGDPSNSQGPWSKKTTRDGALSNWIKDENAVKLQLELLLKYCREKIPIASHYTTILILRATAGLRTLPVSDQQKILEGVSKILSQAGFRFQRDWASVMSGTQEGVGGWITTNYLSDRIVQGDNNTLGALDLGGSSMEITYQIPKKISSENYFNVTFNPKLQFDLFAVEFPGFGLDQVSLKVGAKSVKLDNINPCRPSGSNQTVDYKVQFGGSNATACLEILNEIVNKTGGRAVGPNNLAMPPIPIGMNFIAYSGFYYGLDFFGLSRQNFSLNDLLAKATVFCDKSYSQIEQEYPPPKYDPNWLTSYCLYGLWSYALLDGLNFDPSAKQISSFDNLHNITLTWAPGIMLYEVGLAPRVKYCSMHTECKTCLENSACGWCYKAEKCFPGDADGGFNSTCTTEDWMFASTGGYCKSSTQPANLIVASVAGGAVLLLILITGLIILWRKHFINRKENYVNLQ